MTKRKEFTEEQKLAAVKLLVEGMPTKDVASMFDVKPQSINRWKRDYKDRVVVPETSIEHKIVVASEEIEEAHRSMTIRAINVAELMINELYNRIQDQKESISIDQISRALTAINGCIKIGHKEGGQLNDTQRSYYNHIESLIIQNNSGNPNFLKT